MFVQIGRCANSARLLAVVGIGLTGCGSGLLSNSADGPQGTLGLGLLVTDDSPTFQESGTNDFLELADRVTLSDVPSIVRGSIRTSNDVDVYDLGPVSPGERIQVAVSTDSTLAGNVALFDETGTVLLVNDNRNVYLGVREPFIDVTMRRSSNACYLAMSSTSNGGFDGNYDLFISKANSQPILPPRPDEILLVFDGGTGVTIGSRPAIDVPVFDAALIDSTFAGTTDVLIDRVVELVRSDYEAFNISILSTSEGATFDGSRTRLYFGTFDPGLLGVAEGVDEFNLTRGQVAIVFTETFDAFMTLRPSVEEMARALANVASHEIGHLMGLVHTSDPAGIMDVTGSLRDLTTDQEFRISPIHNLVFGLGFQNEVQYLLDALGGDASVAAGKLSAEHRLRGVGAVKPTGPPCRAVHVFSSCGLDH